MFYEMMEVVPHAQVLNLGDQGTFCLYPTYQPISCLSCVVLADGHMTPHYNPSCK